MLSYPHVLNRIPNIEQRHFLEIGHGTGNNFRAVKCAVKHSVDPFVEAATFRMTSDDFFRSNTNLYDIILIDGDHDSKTVFRDWNNAIKCVRPSGVILLHDLFPTNEKWVYPNPHTNLFCGDGYRILVAMLKLGFDLRTYLDDFGMTSVFTHAPIDFDQVPWNMSYQEFRHMVELAKRFFCTNSDGFANTIIEKTYVPKEVFNSL